MRGSSFRRGGRDLVGDAIERLRGDWVAVTLLHVLPSVPFLVGAISVAVAIDMRGALPGDGLTDLALLFLLKMLGWAALAAWSAAAARGRPAGIGTAWLRVLRRLPEVVLAGSLACLGFVAGAFSAGLGWIAVAPPLLALAATTSDDTVGGWRMLRRGLGAALENLDRAAAIVGTAACAGALLVANLMVLLPVLLALGAGGLGLDLEILGAGFGFSRFATWTFAACVASLVVEAFVVAAFAELDADREMEREGVRFEQFAAELEARDATAGARSAA